MAKLNLNFSEGVRSRLAQKEEEKIAVMYGQLAEKVRQEANALEGVKDSRAAERARLRTLGNQLEAAQRSITGELEKDIENNMRKTAEAVAQDSINFLKQVKFEVKGAYSSVPDDVVRSIVSGNIYGPLPDGSNWSLNGAIWKDQSKFGVDIREILARGTAENKSAYEIAKDLEKYVNPSARKDWDWSKVYPGTNKKVDYNAQRLARTLISHAFQLALVTTTARNPFVEGYIWHSALAHGRTCEICESLDGTFFEKGRLPLDHPNGLCYWECVIPELTKVAERIGDWVNGKSDRELDIFADSITRSNTRSAANSVRQSGSVLD